MHSGDCNLKFHLSDKQKSIVILAVLSIFVIYLKETLFFAYKVFSAISPLLLGILLALVIRPALCFFEEKILKKSKLKPKTKRILSLLFAYSSFAIAIFFVIYVLVPQIAISVSNFAEKLSDLTLGLNTFLRGAMEFFGASEEAIEGVEGIVYSSIQKLGVYIIENLPNVASFAFSLWGKVTTFCFAVIFSVYILFDKEKLRDAFFILTRKLFKRDTSKKIMVVFSEITESFSAFFSGQIVEALILGALCFAGMLLLKLPYAPLISTIMMVTAVIPLLGAFIGTIPSSIIILLVNPFQAVIFLVFVLVLQAVEGNLIYPYVVGSKVDLPPLVILFAVLAGGNLFGVCGVLIAVPLASVAYKYLISYLHEKN